MAVITISRQYGGPGDEIAARVCKRLEYRYFDKALMAQVAAEMNLSEAEIADFSEDDYKARRFVERLLSRRSSREVAGAAAGARNTASAPAKMLTQLNRERYIGIVRSAIEAAYAQGDVVIVGRGGQAILRDRPGVLHARIETPQEVRFAHILYQPEFSGLTSTYARKMAQEKISERDSASADYLMRFYGLDWSDRKLYHLVIDTERWRVEAAACLIASAANCL